MYKGIQITGPYELTFEKTFWDQNEMDTALCMGMTITEGTEKAVKIVCNIAATEKRALFEFLQGSFKTVMVAPDYKPFRDSLFAHLTKSYQSLFDGFLANYLIRNGTHAGYPKKLYHHQLESVLFSCYHKHSLLALEQGLGKTISAATVSKVMGIKKTLIICPAVVKWNWFRELTQEWGYNVLYFSLLDASQRKTIKAQFFERFIIINYDILGKYMPYIEAAGIGHIILDECQMVKSQTQRTKAVERIVKHYPDAKITMLSGTPVKNRVNDMFSYLRLAGHPLGKNRSAFLRTYTHFGKGRGGERITGGKNLPDLYRKISNFVFRRTKEECLDLPEKIITKYFFQLDDYKAEYDKVLREMIANNQDTNIHSSLHSLNIVVSKSKLKGIIELIDGLLEQDKKVVVFGGYKEPLDILQKHYGDRCVKIDGSVAAQKRDDLIQRFKNNENCTVFLGNMIAAGVGINLTNASDVIFLNFPFTPADLEQAVDRLHRIGQKSCVNVYYTICEDSIDTYIYDIIADKRGDINELIDRGKGAVSYENIPGKLFSKLIEDFKSKNPNYEQESQAAGQPDEDRDQHAEALQSPV